MVIVETRQFTARVRALLGDEVYREFQLALVARPTAGDVIPETGGLRKVRWGMAGTGKRGGVRIIYFYHQATERILMLFVFAKNERSDLTPAERRQLRRIVEEEYP